ncbi:MAG: hypothetical protein ABIF09_19015 [Gemmatimonadota bacterium]
MRPGTILQAVGVLLVLGLAAFPASAGAQVEGAPSPAADPADVESVDAIVAAVYDVISGPAGQARAWDRWRSLFIPEARLIAVSPNQEGGIQRRVMTPSPSPVASIPSNSCTTEPGGGS